MNFSSAPYKNATSLANHLLRMLLADEKCSMAYAACARQWLEIEQTKREWRGRPRLAPAHARDLLKLKLDSMKQVTTVESFSDPDEAPTVTAPRG